MTEHHRVVIIGAGLGGIAAAVGLLADHVDDFVILEQAPGVGGTWYHNRYPGAECDVMSHLYSFSFAPNPYWTRRYARQPEILAYIEGVADRFGIGAHVRLASPVRAMNWEERGQRWRIEAEGGTLSADFVISAVGMFNEPVMPRIDGLEDFGGCVVHTARWPAGEYFPGKRVAVIGSAATAVQLVPELAETVEMLYVLQRTPVWVMPKDDRPFTSEDIGDFSSDPAALQALRAEIEARVNRTMTFEDPEIGRVQAEGGVRNIAVVNDPEIKRRLTPTLPWGSRRPIISNLYYPAFNRPNVELVSDPILRVEASGILTAQGRLLEVDVIVCATGFAVSKYLSVIEVTGQGGRKLNEDWAEDPSAYLGVMTPGYPNLVMLYGPNTNNGSILTMLESQAQFAVRQLRWMTEEAITSFAVRAEVAEAYNAQLQIDLDTIAEWRVEPDGYYRGRSGRIVTQWPHSMSDYDARLRATSPDIFHTVSKKRAARWARGTESAR